MDAEKFSLQKWFFFGSHAGRPMYKEPIIYIWEIAEFTPLLFVLVFVSNWCIYM